MLFRIAFRNAKRRKVHTILVVFGLLIGTAIISSSLVVGDTLNYIFVEDVYKRLDVIDEIVAKRGGGNLALIGESNFTTIKEGLRSLGSPVDGVAPVLVKYMPVRNVPGNKGNQQVTVMGIDSREESGFGELRDLSGRVWSTAELADDEVLVNERAAKDLNVSLGDVLTLFWGTSNNTILYVKARAIVIDEGKADWEHRSLIFMELSRAQRGFDSPGLISFIKISNIGDRIEGVRHTDLVSSDIRSIVSSSKLSLSVQEVKRDQLGDAEQISTDVTQIFLVMGAFSIIAGVLLIINIFVMLAEERKGEMGISRAVGMLRLDLTLLFVLEGAVYVAFAAAVGTLAGLALGYVIVYMFSLIFPLEEGLTVTFYYDPNSLVIALGVGVVITFLTVSFASWRVSKLNIVRAIRDLSEPSPYGLSFKYRVLAFALIAASFFALCLGCLYDVGAGRIAGVPLLILGSSVAAMRFLPPRLPFSVAGAGILAWLLGPFDLVNEKSDDVYQLFVLTGIFLVLGAVLLTVFNFSSVLRFLLRLSGGRRGHPVLTTAIAYPMNRKFRTGMTLAMFALVLFTVTVISMIQGMQDASLESVVSGQSGGYDIIGFTGDYGTIPNFRQQLKDNGIDLSLFDGGEKGVAVASVVPIEMRRIDQNLSQTYTLWGIDNFLIESNQYDFLTYLPFVLDSSGHRVSLSSREDVWKALALNKSYAVVDRSAAGANQFTPQFSQARLWPGDQIEISDPSNPSMESFRLTIVGILEQALEFTSGIFTDQSVVSEHFAAQNVRTAYFFQLAPGVDSREVGDLLEDKFFTYGLRTIDIREQINQAFEVSRRVLFLMEAYLGIGLMVGIAGLGVITVRAVIERRQQIGTLRALGFTREMVAAGFLIELSFVAFLGIAIGVALGIALSYNVWRIYFSEIAVFIIPWANVAVVMLVAFCVTLLSTSSPALKASRIPPAEALRFVE